MNTSKIKIVVPLIVVPLLTGCNNNKSGPTLSYITCTTNRLGFAIGETITTDDYKVTAYYSDDSKKDITDYSFGYFEKLPHTITAEDGVGNFVIDISYKDSTISDYVGYDQKLTIYDANVFKCDFDTRSGKAKAYIDNTSGNANRKNAFIPNLYYDKETKVNYKVNTFVECRDFEGSDTSKKLKYVTLDDNIETICPGAFGNCSFLEAVSFLTPSMWELCDEYGEVKGEYFAFSSEENANKLKGEYRQYTWNKVKY